MAATRRPWWPSMVAIVIVAGFGLYLWAWNDAQHAFAEVRVVADATPLQCSGIEPGFVEREVDTSSTFSLYRIELRRAMQCQIEFHIQNTGSRDVDVDTVIIPLARAGAQGALAVRIEPNSLLPYDWGVANDVAFDLGISLRPDEQRTFRLFVTFQDGICSGPDSTMYVDDYVRLELSRWVFSGRAGIEYVPIAFTGTTDTGNCNAEADG